MNIYRNCYLNGLKKFVKKYYIFIFLKTIPVTKHMCRFIILNDK